MIRRRIFVPILFIALLIFTVNHLFSDAVNDSDKPLDTSDEKASPVNPMDPAEPLYKVVIDPGHGGTDPGADGASGRVEKDFNLQLSLKVKELLEKESKIQVNLTRIDDTFISSIDRERVEFANELEADLFISIHGNTYTDPSVSGTETYYYDEASLSFAEVIHHHVVKATGFRDRGVKQEDYFVVKETNMPAVLIEVGYLTHPKEEQKMWEDEFQKQVAVSIVEGIKEYLEIHN